MAYIKKPGKLTGRDIYYTGESHWSDDINDKLVMSTSEANAKLVRDTFGKYDGWSEAVVVE
jgi:hypothetical protein